jgi:uncharacterized protein YndB with AHSA1/START domain
MGNEPIVIERVYHAPVKVVWEAITELEKMKVWYFPMLTEFKPEIGFETVFDVEENGKNYPHIWKVTEVVPGRKISYEWKFGGYPGNTVVSFELFPEGDSTKVVLTHLGIETFRGDLYPELASPMWEEGWTNFIGVRLKKYVE